MNSFYPILFKVQHNLPVSNEYNQCRSVLTFTDLLQFLLVFDYNGKHITRWALITIVMNSPTRDFCLRMPGYFLVML